jgi:hypothetical protein
MLRHLDRFEFDAFRSWLRNTVRELELSHIVPVMRDQLDTPEPQYLGLKCGLVAVCLVVYLLGLWGTERICIKRLEKLDF